MTYNCIKCSLNTNILYDNSIKEKSPYKSKLGYYL